MSESQSLPMNFGGIAEAEFSSFENSRILVWPTERSIGFPTVRLEVSFGP